MSWLHSLFAPHCDADRLRAELDTRTGRITELERKLEASEARLLTEIESNRRREDAFKDDLLSLIGTQRRLPYRQTLEAGTAYEAKPAEAEEIVPADPEFEDLVNERAKDFADEALNTRGIAYSPEDMAILRERIKANPAEYLQN